MFLKRAPNCVGQRDPQDVSQDVLIQKHCFSKGVLAVSCVWRVSQGSQVPGIWDLPKVRERMVWTPGGAAGRPERGRTCRSPSPPASTHA